MTRQRLYIGVLILLFCGVGGFFVSEPSIVQKEQVLALELNKKQKSTYPPLLPYTITNNHYPVKQAYQLWLESELISKPVSERFYKVDMDGQLLQTETDHWVCVYDSFSGLMWEVKQNDGGWQDKEHTYSWYEPSIELPSSNFNKHNINAAGIGNKLEYGAADLGRCYKIRCDTHSYKIAVNKDWLCSSNNWRLPYAHELALLDHPVNYHPDIDTDYFPNTALGQYWSRTEAPSSKTLAWSVDFQNGFPYITEKRLDNSIRLVTEAHWLTEELNAMEANKYYKSQ